MPVLSNVVGLDLGSHSIKAVEFRQNLRGPEAVQLRGVEREGEELTALLRRFIEQYRLPVNHIVAALPGDRILTRRVSFPFRERRKLASAIPHAIADDVPFESEDLLIDWDIVSSDRSHADVVVAISPRVELSSFLDSFVEAECEPRTVEAEGLVLANLAAVFELPGAQLMIDLGHRKTTFCLLVDERAVAARTVPVGGLALTQAIAKDRGISQREAERSKHEDPWLDMDSLVGLPETAAALDRIAREIVRTLGSTEALLGSRTVDSLTLLGGTALLSGLDAYLTARTGIPAQRLGYPPESAGAGLVAAGDPVIFAPTIALGLRGTARSRTQMNFRQDEFAMRLDLGRFGREFIWTGALAASALVLGIASFATSTSLQSARASQLEVEVARLYSEAVPGEAPSGNSLAALRSAVDSANERAEFLGVYRGNLSALDLLTEISKQVPEDLDIQLEELSIDRQTLRMRVKATSFESADRLGAELAKFPPFAEARIGAIETDRKTGAKRFNVTLSLGGKKQL